jgi:ABC-type nitrate/sulfonate/bicarbonate transport system ATPase subunit
MAHSCPKPAAISVKDVTFWYSPAEPIFRDFNWQMREGESWSIIGPSGCGKTTLLYLLAGLHRPLAGTISLGDKPVTGPTTNVGLMLQDYGLLPWLTVRDNVQLGLKIRSLPAKECRQTAMHWLEQLGIGGIADRFPYQLSGGQRQRVALARVLALQPDVLLLDEPFSSVDELTREQLQRLMAELKSRIRTTVVLVTHNIEEAALLTRRVLILSRNSPVEAANVVSSPFDGQMPSRRDPAFQDFCARLREELGLCR